MLIPLLVFAGCDGPQCLDGDEGCEIASPCPGVEFTCDGGYTEAYTVGPDTPGPGGMAALAATGDIVLGNDQVVAVIDALDHPHYVAPSGGSLLDLSLRGQDDDAMRNVFQATGLLPQEAAHYTSIELLDEGDVKAVQVIGTLDDRPDIPIATRYEIRPCEPGVRVRTEFANGSPDALSVFLTDGFYWGDRDNIAFTPRPDGGFNHPSFGLSTVADAMFEVPFMVAGLHSSPGASYGTVSCDDETLSGFESVYVSAVGKAPRVMPGRDWDTFDRFILAADGPSVSKAADVALELRRQLWGEAYATVSGKLDAPGGHLGSTMRAAVQLVSGTTPWTHVIPADDGTWSARVPAGQDYTAEIQAFGKTVSTQELGTIDGDTDVGTLSAPAVGEVTLDVTIDGAEDHALVFVVPSDDATAEAVSATTYGQWDPCAPNLGLPHGGSPGCNRVLVDGPTTIALPDGTYDFYTSAGPFSTLGAALSVKVDATTAQTVPLDVTMLDLQPAGTLTGDFHVHGARSFDAEIPDLDRVKAFLAARIQVIISTEHDAVNDYAEAVEELGAAARIHLVNGVETTGHILFHFRTDVTYPEVIGHWIFWPLPMDPLGPYRGAAWDEKMEPGALFDAQKAAGWDEDLGVNQLNHPIGGMQFGRDYSWGSAAGFKVNEPLVQDYDGSGQSLFFHTPDGAQHSNADYDVQEVMNGSWNENYEGYRTFWFWLLDQGVVRAGTANSDSHSLTENVLGTPRNVVYTSTTFDDFDLGTFDADVRAGHILGTNGPVIEATVGTHTPSTTAFTPSGGDTLHVAVRAAPWVPVDEVRIVVDGEVAQTLDGLPVPGDPFGAADLDRLDTDVPLSDLVDCSAGDHWIVVEAGHALPTNEDLNCDGIPDTGDNNGDGSIDWHDVDGLEEDPGVDCYDTVGPMTNPPAPERGSADWTFQTVEPNGYPLSFTNPFLIDCDGNGFAGAGK